MGAAVVAGAPARAALQPPGMRDGQLGGLPGGRALQAAGIDVAKEVGRRVGGVLDQEAVLEERQPSADLVDQLLFELPGDLVTPADLLALERRDVLAILGRGGGLVAACRAGGLFDVYAHRGAVDLALDDRLGELGEPERVHLHQALGPGVGGAVGVAVAVQRDRDDHAAGTAVVGVVMVDENRLAEEGLVPLFDLSGRERVVVVVGPAGDHPGADVQVPGPGLVVEGDPVRGFAQLAGLGESRAGRLPGLQDLQAGILPQHRALRLLPPSGL